MLLQDGDYITPAQFAGISAVSRTTFRTLSKINPGIYKTRRVFNA